MKAFAGKAMLTFAFFISIITLPWWVALILALMLLALYGSFATVLIGGILLDLVFGSPQPALSGFAYIYTALFTVLAAASGFLSNRMLG